MLSYLLIIGSKVVLWDISFWYDLSESEFDLFWDNDFLNDYLKTLDSVILFISSKSSLICFKLSIVVYRVILFLIPDYLRLLRSLANEFELSC